MAPKLLVSGVVKNLRQMIAAGAGGILSTIFDVVTLKLLVAYSPASIPLAAFLAAGVGAVVCFLFNKYISFRDGQPVTFEQVARFAAVAFSTGLLTAGAMKIVAVDLHVPLLVAKAICAATVFAVWTFPAQRRFVFKPAPRPASASI